MPETVGAFLCILSSYGIVSKRIIRLYIAKLKLLFIFHILNVNDKQNLYDVEVYVNSKIVMQGINQRSKVKVTTGTG